MVALALPVRHVSVCDRNTSVAFSAMRRRCLTGTFTRPKSWRQTLRFSDAVQNAVVSKGLSRGRRRQANMWCLYATGGLEEPDPGRDPRPDVEVGRREVSQINRGSGG